MLDQQNQNTLKVLITGATGKIGSRLTPRLLQWGYTIRALVRDAGGASALRSIGVETVTGNLLDPDSLKNAVQGMDVVIHLATFYQGATEDQSRSANLNGTAALARAAIDTGVRQFIFASSNRVYGAGRGKMVRETDPVEPGNNRFAVAKVAAEDLLIQLFEDQAASLCILRLSLTYGEGDTHLKETIPALKDWPQAKRMQMVHHADIAQAIKRCIVQRAKGIYNVTDDAPLSIAELRELHQLPSGSEAPVVDPWEMMVSNRKIREELGYRPCYPTFYSAYDAGTL
ncbi:NAD-dependent epimerase/dehydratase family protein [Mucilaginibacter sp. KACC 22063]|uniref:NAD-dependent epimerase/dehydratase family protein n=1 Tax=Mucilaginibacter sp. KACC 22063 TaxID=3025666 RepID=UPI002365E478|nr:NAD(P)-dependent oxidoreductase [Mucilaginibacter sp. KACC 22063]WDF54237.1 NAD(P)-dependent oxidoreductase [Mucilaginibacter sp. KACC 22063]